MRGLSFYDQDLFAEAERVALPANPAPVGFRRDEDLLAGLTAEDWDVIDAMNDADVVREHPGPYLEGEVRW